MRNRTRPQAARIEADLQARRQAAAQAVADKRAEREMADAVSLAERELGAVPL